MAGMNIAERRLPQDGRIKLWLGGREIDIRVSTIPTIFGESVVLRLLYQETEELGLEALGLVERDMALLQEKIYYPNGIILVTGPTGSGKTTTLYAVLKKIKSPEKKIITVEDPVEYQIEGINQIQVRPDLDLTFGKCLRSIVRQDPDVILIGEIRDLETAEIAIQSALTGHLVFSTLHTNDAPTAITRLTDLQVESYLISASLLLVVAQRLVRVLCSHCKAPFKPDRTIIKRIKTYFPPEIAEKMELDSKDLTFYQSVGCPECGHTGYLGRVAVFEVMEVTDRLRSLIIEGADIDQIKREAIKERMTTMRMNGLKKVINGITTIEEILRVTKL
jgi:general secretion pathway protein E